MSAETLRRAAALMRERAECGSPREFPTPWATEQCDVERYGVADRVTCDEGKGDVTDALDPLCAAHIASWHPAVALAVADLLDTVANDLRDDDDCGACWLCHERVNPERPDCECSEHRALAVTRAYLGEASC